MTRTALALVLMGLLPEVAVADRVGNEGRCRLDFLVDAEAPRIRVRLPDGTQAKPGDTPQIRFGETVGLDFEDTASGVGSHRVWLNGGPLPAAPTSSRSRPSTASATGGACAS